MTLRKLCILAVLLTSTVFVAGLPNAAAVVPGTCQVTGGSVSPSGTGASVTGTSSGTNTWCRTDVVLRWITSFGVFSGCSASASHRVGVLPPPVDTATATCTDTSPPNVPGSECAVGDIYAYRWSVIDSGWVFTDAASATGSGSVCVA